jgi:hypothetical protein
MKTNGFLRFWQVQNVTWSYVTVAFKICFADLDATVFEEWHYSFKDVSFINADLSVIAPSLHKIAKLLILVTVANFYRLCGCEQVVLLHVNSHAIVSELMLLWNRLVVSVQYLDSISLYLQQRESCRQCIISSG